MNESEIQTSLFDELSSAEKEVYHVNALLRRGDAAARNSSISYIFKELERVHTHVYMSKPGLHLSWMDLYEQSYFPFKFPAELVFFVRDSGLIQM